MRTTWKWPLCSFSVFIIIYLFFKTFRTVFNRNNDSLIFETRRTKFNIFIMNKPLKLWCYLQVFASVLYQIKGSLTCFCYSENFQNHEWLLNFIQWFFFYFYHDKLHRFCLMSVMWWIMMIDFQCWTNFIFPRKDLFELNLLTFCLVFYICSWEILTCGSSFL